MITARYNLTFEEWSEAQDLWCKREAGTLPGMVPLKAVYYALCACSGVAAVLPPHWPGLVFSALLITQSSIVSWRKEPVRRFLYSQATDRDKEVMLRVDDQGYFSERPGFNECRMSWECFTGWREGSLTFVLGRGMQYCSVPKRALSDEALEELRSLLRAKLS